MFSENSLLVVSLLDREEVETQSRGYIHELFSNCPIPSPPPLAVVSERWMERKWILEFVVSI